MQKNSQLYYLKNIENTIKTNQKLSSFRKILDKIIEKNISNDKKT